MRKLKYKEVKQLAQGHIASNCLELRFDSRDRVFNHCSKNYVGVEFHWQAKITYIQTCSKRSLRNLTTLKT